MSIRIMIVDDEDDNRDLIHYYLKKELPDAEFLPVKSGDEALNLIPKHVFDAIITDCRMPGMDGLTLTRTIREMGIKTPIIMRSDLIGIDRKANDAGVTRILSWASWRELGIKTRELIEAYKSKP